jgi:hypothetical protein
MSDYRPPEYLRLGGDPHPLPEPGPDIEWNPYDADGQPRISNFGGGLVFAAELVDIRTCPRCQAELVTPQFLKLHMEEKHGE